MVAKTPPKERKMVAPLNPVVVRETLKKVEMCMGRLQELHNTVTGGKKMISGLSLSPRSSIGYLKTSLRCKQESLWIKNGGARKSPVGKFPANAVGEWQRMSLPAMLLGETVGEILEATKFARDIVESMEDPKTPLTQDKKQRPKHTELIARRKREKQEQHRTELHTPGLRRARSRINFKISPPPKTENHRYLTNRVSPRNRPWLKKAVLFPNPLFISSENSQPKFSRTNSPIIGRNKQTPHKFMIKSPPTSASKYTVKIRSPPVTVTVTRPSSKRSFSPSKMTAASQLRRSFSPSRLAARLVSPLKSRKSVQKTKKNYLPEMRHTPTQIQLGI